MRVYNLPAPWVGRVSVYQEGAQDGRDGPGQWVAVLAVSRVLSSAETIEARGPTEQVAAARLVNTLTTLAEAVSTVLGLSVTSRGAILPK